MTFPFRSLVLLLTVVFVVPGCSSSAKDGGVKGPVVEDRLREVGEILALHSGGTKKGFAKPTDLAIYESGFPFGYQAVKTGDIVIVKGATMPGEGDSTGSSAVVAYEKQVPTEGGLVLLHNRTIQKMTAEQFKSALKGGS